jgi:hypothetical protein
MASAIIHICVAKKINEKLNRNEKILYLGTIAPDLSKHVGETKINSHFLTNPLKPEIPNISKFIELYKNDINNDFELGYLIHLYTDKLWFSGFIDNLVLNTSVKLIDGDYVIFEPEEIKKLIYNDYTNINIDLIDYYNLDLKLFYEEFTYPSSKIKEIPMDKLRLIIDQMGIIIENSGKEKNYIFDIYSVTDFIEKSATEIYNYLIENNLVRGIYE